MSEIYRFSAPGRTEIGGNHTDHQHGCVLAAAVDLETTAEVVLTEEPLIRVSSEGYAPVEIRLDDLTFREEERGSTAALVRGTAAIFRERGAKLRGLTMSVRSSVLPGSGLSSSAAFEVLLGAVFNALFLDGTLSAVELAKIGRQAENRWFGKPCGLMDQTASAVGGMVFIDFADPADPVVEKVEFDFAAAGHALCIIDSGADHANLTAEYAAIPEELGEVCHFFGKKWLREVAEEEFLAALPRLRGKVTDRALLRALHIYGENRRVPQQVQALKDGNFAEFLRHVRESGQSSWMYLQNIMPVGAVRRQEVALALALCDRLLEGAGAFRVHGGGFAGTVQAFVPLDRLDVFREGICRVFGKDSCKVLSIRAEGAGSR